MRAKYVVDESLGVARVAEVHVGNIDKILRNQAKQLMNLTPKHRTHTDGRRVLRSIHKTGTDSENIHITSKVCMVNMQTCRYGDGRVR